MAVSYESIREYRGVDYRMMQNKLTGNWIAIVDLKHSITISCSERGVLERFVRFMIDEHLGDE